MGEQKDKTKIKLIDLLKSHPDGLTIQEIMTKTKLARHTILSRLHELIGADKVGVRQINMAKLHRWKYENEPREEKEIGGVDVTSLKNEHLKIPEKELKQILKKEIELDKKISKEFDKGLKKISESSNTLDKSLNIDDIKNEIEGELRSGKLKKSEALMKEQREPIKRSINKKTDKKSSSSKVFIKTGVPGFDELLDKGIPQGTTLIIAGGAGSGKTIFCLQTLMHHVQEGKKCLYMSFEESEDRLISHMEDFGWNPRQYIKKGNLKVKRFNPFDITRNVDALLAKQKGELLIDVDPIIIPSGYNPDFIVVDSLTAIASAFTSKDESYRIYIEQLFRFFEKIGATSLLITETEQVPKIFSETGVEEFLADGVIVLYNIKHGNVRENAIEVLKLRGVDHEKKIVAMNITSEGIVVYPEQEVFSEIDA